MQARLLRRCCAGLAGDDTGRALLSKHPSPVIQSRTSSLHRGAISSFISAPFALLEMGLELVTKTQEIPSLGLDCANSPGEAVVS